MLPENKIRFQNIILIILIAIIFGMLYNLFFYPSTLVEFLEAGTISIFIGLFLGTLEEFVFKKSFLRLSLYKVLLIRTILYSLLISIILSLVLSIELSFTEQISYSDALIQYLSSPLFRRDYLFSISFVFLILFIIQIIQLIGKANFFRLIVGIYHKPREVNRIYMFLDLKDSTTIAEKLSNLVYSTFINQFIFDVSDAIIMFRGEVYQYVGDEIVVVWPITDTNINCIRCFFKMKEIINGKREYYQSKYGIYPQFKAGIHAGKVIVAEIGKQKKEIVYHGDVLNTTSRIEGKCNDLKQQLLISEDMLNYIDQQDEFLIQDTGEIELKGKEQKLKLYGVTLKEGLD
jgi:adenylate cyclase